MPVVSDKLPATAISREFSARLAKLKVKQPVRALVMLAADGGLTVPVRRAQRAALLEHKREAARALLPEIDRILARHNGRRLSEDVDALGSITVETTAAGIKALAASGQVKTILEDQPVYKLS
jgi:hypothetical protein